MVQGPATRDIHARRMEDEEEEAPREALVPCVEAQLGEVELLQAMFPAAGELRLLAPGALHHLTAYLAEPCLPPPPHLHLLLRLGPFELSAELPSLYPRAAPALSVRADSLPRAALAALNADLARHLQAPPQDDAPLHSVHSAVAWLQERAESCAPAPAQRAVCDGPLRPPAPRDLRLWVRSHHIYSKRKREQVAGAARRLRLAGFCLPGKPGVLCVEGEEAACADWWREVKSMTWKKIQITKSEKLEPEDRKFTHFEELHFPNTSSKNTKHADMSGFSKYMEERGLAGAFSEFFGLD